jgi:hypothetical protein
MAAAGWHGGPCDGDPARRASGRCWSYRGRCWVVDRG